jgi:hypothetical protein
MYDSCLGSVRQPPWSIGAVSDGDDLKGANIGGQAQHLLHLPIVKLRNNNTPEAARLDGEQEVGRGLLDSVWHGRAWRQAVEGVVNLHPLEVGGVVLEPAAGGQAFWRTISRQCG